MSAIQPGDDVQGPLEDHDLQSSIHHAHSHGDPATGSSPDHEASLDGMADDDYDDGDLDDAMFHPNHRATRGRSDSAKSDQEGLRASPSRSPSPSPFQPLPADAPETCTETPGDDWARYQDADPESGRESDGAFPETHDWEMVTRDFRNRIRDNRHEDLALEARFYRLMEFYATYRSTGVIHEEQRAAKRLCTRVAYVQHAEQQLKAQRTHYESVCSAFQGALDLLQSGETRGETALD